MKLPRVRITVRRMMLIVGAIAVLFLALARIGVKGLYSPGCELRHSLWLAGTVSSRPGNDLWIEYGAVSLRPVGIYRDFDGDGLVDECLAFSGPFVAIYRASHNDGILDTVRDIGDPLRPVERLPRDSPEAGPFTRAILDERVRAYPLGVQADGPQPTGGPVNR